MCISILHPPGNDQYGYESRNERWLPVHNVESIAMSVILMLIEPNFESPVNVDAATLYRGNNAEYKRWLLSAMC